jgi:nicotinamidase/pyrazinamidase
MKAAVIVDAQYDFMEGGSLAVPEGNQIIPVINELISKFELVIFTKDWHPAKMEAFASYYEGKRPYENYTNSKGKKDTLWPDHCVQNTRGADIHEDIKFELINGDFYIFKKGLTETEHPYSGFEAEGLLEFLQEKNVHQVFVAGLALDFCVRDTIIDSIKNGFETILILDGTRGITEEGVNETIKEFSELGGKIIESWELPLFNLL